MPFSPRDEESVYNAVKNSDIVINLIGKDYETEHLVSSVRPDGSRSRVNYSFEDTNVEVARTIARISKEAGVKGLVHVSAMAADLNSESEWSRTKAQGEHAVRAEFPEAVSTSLLWLVGMLRCDALCTAVCAADHRAPLHRVRPRR